MNLFIYLFIDVTFSKIGFSLGGYSVRSFYSIRCPLTTTLSVSLTPNLVGVYGMVMRVKIMFNKRDTALIQFADSLQARLGLGPAVLSTMFEKRLVFSHSASERRCPLWERNAYQHIETRCCSVAKRRS